MADLFGVGGKKPAQLIQSIEEKGCYSAGPTLPGWRPCCAPNRTTGGVCWRCGRSGEAISPPASAGDAIESALARRLYGFEHRDMEAILAYTPVEYQKIERGVGPLSDAGRARILEAVHRAGQRRVETLLKARDQRDLEREAGASRRRCRPWSPCWPPVKEVHSPDTISAPCQGYQLLARPAAVDRPGTGSAPLAPGYKIGLVCGVPDLSTVLDDWREQYRRRLQVAGCSPPWPEVRLLIAEVATTARAFSRRLGLNPSVLVRDLQRLDKGKGVKWFHVERILTAAGVAPHERRWEQIHAWWYATRVE